MNKRIDTAWLTSAPIGELMQAASAVRDRHFGNTVSYSKKVFIPLTQMCRDACHYCTFSKRPQKNRPPYLSPEEVLAIARRGEATGCTEALFTLGDKPELRYAAARRELSELGYRTTIGYLAAMCELVLRETRLLPHVNAGVMRREEMARLREFSVSQGLMLESVSARLMLRGHVHHGSPDKDPAVRLENIRLAGELSIPFTTGILIGIGETRAERIQSLLEIARLGDAHGHVQEVIVQNFRAKPGTRAAGAAEPDLADLLWTVSAARLILGGEVSVQAPPNLSPANYDALVRAGINDWGGISPVTIDHVNPELPWPSLIELDQRTAGAGKTLVGRLPVYPNYVSEAERWLTPTLARRVRALSDAEGFARDDEWAPGVLVAPRSNVTVIRALDPSVGKILDKAMLGTKLAESEIVHLFAARGENYKRVCLAADTLRQSVSGEIVRYVVNRNINYTNICAFKCRFCAFAKGKTHDALRGMPYVLEMEEIVRRVQEAWQRGATEVCMQGGIHPAYTGATYLEICRAVKAAVPSMHIHAFSPLEVFQGAATLGVDVSNFLVQLKDAGLGTLPGTAAEILDDDVRAFLCPDKITTAQWLSVVGAAHAVGIKTTATIMFGHMERPLHWARHLLAIRNLQADSGGLTEFVPLPFVHMEAPMYLQGLARKGPTFREAVLMHAVARLALHPLVPNIQTSWVKMGPEGAAACLKAGANDLGGTLMNESISRAAGTEHGQEFPPAAMERLIRASGRIPQQRFTTYGHVPDERRKTSFTAPALAPMHFSRPPKKAVRECA